MALGRQNIGQLEYKTLIAGNFPVEQEVITLKQPTEGMVRGSVIGLTTADKKGVLLKKAAADGSQNFYGILLHDVEKATADVSAVVAVTGDFIEDNLIFGESTTAEDVRAAAQAKNVYFHKLVNKFGGK